VAVTLSSILMTLVTTLFFAQNQFYAEAIVRSHVQENARSVTEFVAAELRGLGGEAFTLAESRQFVVRRPLVVGIVCNIRNNDTNVYLPLNGEAVPADDVAGYAVRDGVGGWAYYAEVWEDLTHSNQEGPVAAGYCAPNGIDTVGIIDDFYSLHDVPNVALPPPDTGSVLMLYQDRHYQFKASDLEAGSIGLYLGNFGDDLFELATGMTPAAGFQYRLRGNTVYQSTVTGSQLRDIDAVRLIATAESTGQVQQTGNNSYSFGWTLDVLLKNVR
jgi:hypothetical protein